MDFLVSPIHMRSVYHNQEGPMLISIFKEYLYGLYCFTIEICEVPMPDWWSSYFTKLALAPQPVQQENKLLWYLETSDT